MGRKRRLDAKRAWWREHLAQLAVGLVLTIVTPAAGILVSRAFEPSPSTGDSSGPPSAPGSERGLIRLTAVTSTWTPQPGQQHRSSGDFSTQQAPPGTVGLLWRVASARQQVTFDVMENRPLGFDPVVFQNVSDGSTTPFQSLRSLYIANPRGANEDFTVTVYAMVQGR